MNGFDPRVLLQQFGGDALYAPRPVRMQPQADPSPFRLRTGKLQAAFLGKVQGQFQHIDVCRLQQQMGKTVAAGTRSQLKKDDLLAAEQEINHAQGAGKAQGLGGLAQKVLKIFEALSLAGGQHIGPGRAKRRFAGLNLPGEAQDLDRSVLQHEVTAELDAFHKFLDQKTVRCGLIEPVFLSFLYPPQQGLGGTLAAVHRVAAKDQFAAAAAHRFQHAGPADLFPEIRRIVGGTGKHEMRCPHRPLQPPAAARVFITADADALHGGIGQIVFFRQESGQA